MSAIAERLYTEEEYLELEHNSEDRHEFIDGALRLMAGTTEEHNDIVLNIATKLLPIARLKGCRVRAESVRLRLPKGSKRKYYYPDVAVVCGPKGEDNRMIENPCFVVEVLSESTADIDRVEKLETYQRIASIVQYVLVDQTRRKIEVYSRHEDKWLYEMLEAGTFEVTCLETTMTLDEVYLGLELSAVTRTDET
jgi:Uma2 family endonuclease